MHPVEHMDQRFTYGDYAQWPEDERWELINGVAYAMAAPQRIHQIIAGQLYRQIGNFLEGHTCEPYIAPFDVRLPENDEADGDVTTNVQPDISVICDPDKLDDKGCRGAPDWIIEVLSPSTALQDMDRKRWLYERHGVKEYWIVHPTDRWVMNYTLGDDGKYGHAQMAGMDEALAVEMLPELSIDWNFMNTAG